MTASIYIYIKKREREERGALKLARMDQKYGQ
jgi:hypothetical protein